MAASQQLLAFRSMYSSAPALLQAGWDSGRKDYNKCPICGDKETTGDEEWSDGDGDSDSGGGLSKSTWHAGRPCQLAVELIT